MTAKQDLSSWLSLVRSRCERATKALASATGAKHAPIAGAYTSNVPGEVADFWNHSFTDLPLLLTLAELAGRVVELVEHDHNDLNDKAIAACEECQWLRDFEAVAVALPVTEEGKR